LLLAFGLWLSTKLRLAGLLFLAWAAVNWALVPFARVVQHLFASHRLRLVRARVLRVSFGSSLLLISMVCLVPFPLRTVTEGVVQPSEDGIVRPKSDVFIREILSSPGSRVRRGEALFACDDPLLVTHVKVLEAELAGLRARKDQAFQKDLVQAQILGAEIARREETLVGEKALLGDLILRSQVDGFFVVVEPEDLPGRFVKKGVAIGYVVDPQSVTARVVVPQAEIDAVRHRTDKVMVRFPARLSEVRQVNIVREVPAASNLLPSPALGTQGGGKITVSPSDNKGATTMEKVFQLDLELPRIDDMVPLNGKVFVRLNHGYEPLVLRWGRGIRRLFLSSFNV